MKRPLAALLLVLGLCWAQAASAHMLWIDMNESRNHPPGHVATVIGFGHALPVDDLLTSEAGIIRLKGYQLVAPDKSRFDLGLPDPAVSEPAATPGGLAVSRGDLGLRKIALGEKTKPGTHQVTLETQPLFFTVYLDKNGKQRMAPKPMDEVEDAARVLASIKYQSYAKAMFSVGKWTAPEPLGYDLELLPLTDLSAVGAGDLVRFRLTYKGNPVNTTERAIRTLTCVSNVYGGPDGFELTAMVIGGEAQFRIPAAGQWVANIYYAQPVDGGEETREVQGKCTVVYTAASLFFTVKP